MPNPETQPAPFKELEDTPPQTRPASPILLAVALLVVGLGMAVALFVSIRGAREADARAARLETAQKAKEGGYRVWALAGSNETLKTPTGAPPLEDLFWFTFSRATPEGRAELLKKPQVKAAYERLKKMDGKFPPPPAPPASQKPAQGAKKPPSTVKQQP